MCEPHATMDMAGKVIVGTGIEQVQDFQQIITVMTMTIIPWIYSNPTWDCCNSSSHGIEKAVRG